MAVHMPMLCQTRHPGTQTSQRSSQHLYRPSSAIALVGAAHKAIDSTAVVTASNLWSPNAPSDGGGLCGSIHFSSNASISEMSEDETL
eukprot:scaffold86119_cov43-Cyclotella_meneghiniana.AAC.1